MQNTTIQERHTIRHLLYKSATLWAIGNTFTITTSFLFLMGIIGIDSGMHTSWMFACTFIASLFRVSIPYLLKSFPTRKWICITSYILHIVTLAIVLTLSCKMSLECSTALVIIIASWLVACIFEAIAFTTFLSWNQALFPHKTYGRFFARREKWRLAGEIIAILVFWGLKYYEHISHENLPESMILQLLIATIATGLLFIGMSTILLLMVPDVRFERENILGNGFRAGFLRLKQPFYCRKFFLVLIYSGLFSFFMQIEQVSQIMFLYYITPGALGAITLHNTQKLIIRTGQWSTSKKVGQLIDQFGTLKVMWISQLITALALICYYFATEKTGFFLISLAGVIWISYVGINVALPKMLFEFSDKNDDTPWLVAYAAIGGFFGTFGVFIGGWIYDTYHHLPYFYKTIFFCALIWRLALALPLWIAYRMQESKKLEKNE